MCNQRNEYFLTFLQASPRHPERLCGDGRRSVLAFPKLEKTVDDGFHFRKSFLWMLDVLYTRFDIREIYLRTIDVLYTRFDIQKGRVRLLDVLN